MPKDKPDAWMPFYIGDYLADTMRLNTEQHGAYLLLLFSYWREGPPADEDGELAAITGLPLKTWRAHRPVLVRYFHIIDGRWRHSRVDDDLVKWAEKRRRAIERAAAGGRGKAASSRRNGDPSSSQAVLNSCSSASSREVEGPTGHSTLSGEDRNSNGQRGGWPGPADFRQAVVARYGDEYARSWLDPTSWQDVPTKAIVCKLSLSAGRLKRDLKALLAEHNIAVKMEGVAA